MHGTKASSMIYKEGAKNIKKGEEYACFCSRDSNECSLEIYPRPNGK